MKKYTRVNFDRHQHKREVFKSDDGNTITVDRLQIDDSSTYCIRFTNTRNSLFVDGDYSRWTFCRPFMPSDEMEEISEHYFVEKAVIGTTQNVQEYSAEETRKSLNNLLFEVEHWGLDPDQVDDSKKVIKELIEVSGDVQTYLATRDYTDISPLNMDDLPLEYSTCYHLLVVLDAYHEICKRLKLKNDDENTSDKNK